MQQNSFLDAFNEVIKLDEGVAEIAQKVAGAAKNAADTAVAKKQVKTQQANDQAKATSESLKPIIDILQPIANAQNQFDDNSIKQISDLINKLPNLDNGVKKQINQILNQQKTVLQNAATQANANGAAEKNPPANNVENPPAGTDAGGVQGDANNIANNAKAKPTVDAINRGLSSGLSVDDLIAYLQTLKK